MDNATPSRQPLFREEGCRELVVRMSTDRADFDLAGFKADTGFNLHEKGSTVYCGPANPESDFHLHVNWLLTDKTLITIVEFAEGLNIHDPDVREPYAENFFSWFAKFITKQPQKAGLSASFKYPRKTRQSKFPLPLKTNLGQSGEVEIDGITFRLSNKPNGVKKIWLTQGDNRMFIRVDAERMIELNKFSPESEIGGLSEVVTGVLEERTP